MSKTVEQAIRDRVSIRRYTDQPVSTELIKELVELTGQAPSAFNVQPWRILAITKQEDKDKLQAAAYNQPQVGAAQVVFVVTSDFEDVLSHAEEIVHPGLEGEKREGFLNTIVNGLGGMPVEARTAWARAQTNIALGYLLVAIEAKGLGSSPMLGFDPKAVKDLYGLSETTEIVGLVAVGYPAEAGFPKFRHSVDRILKFI